MSSSLPRRLAAAALAVLVVGTPAMAAAPEPAGMALVAAVENANSLAPMEGSMFTALSDRQQACYRALRGISLDTILASPDHTVPVSVTGVTGTRLAGHIVDNDFAAADAAAQQEYDSICNDLKAAVIALRYDHPEMLWLDETVSALTDLEEGDGVVTIAKVSYEFEMPYEGKEKALYNDMMAAAKSVAKQAAKQPDTYSKVLAAHDIIAGNATYEHTPDDRLAELLTHSGYSALIPGDSYEPVCDGYSRAFKLVLDQLGIPCVLVSSEGHMWNNVLMDDGFWYNVDVTWDDGRGQKATTYFLVGSHTVVGGQKYCDQENHIELDPFADVGLKVEGRIYPVKSTAAYKYIGRDYETPTPAPTPTVAPSASPEPGPTNGPAPTPAPQYPDVGPAHWAYEEIRAVSLVGWFKGDSHGRFNSEAPMTRAQFAQVMANISGVDLAGYTTSKMIAELFAPYPDLSQDAWYAEVIAWALRSGLMQGDGKGFRPNRPINRQEMCVVLYRALGLKAADEEESFRFADDGDIPGWARNQVYACYAAGLVKGDGQGRFAPKAETKRCQAAAIFARYLRQSGQADPNAVPDDIPDNIT